MSLETEQQQYLEALNQKFRNADAMRTEAANEVRAHKFSGYELSVLTGCMSEQDWAKIADAINRGDFLLAGSMLATDARIEAEDYVYRRLDEGDSIDQVWEGI